MKEKKKSMRTYAVYGNTAAAELILAEDRKRHFTVIAGGKEQNGDCGMATELTGMGVVVSALLGLLETCLIFLGLRLSFSFIPVFSVAVLWASLSILTGAFLELLLSIFGQSVYTCLLYTSFHQEERQVERRLYIQKELCHDPPGCME